MLDDMPRGRSAALVAEPEVALAPVKRRAPVKSKRAWLFSSSGGRPKESWLGMLLKPVGISLALILCTYALFSLGITFYRSYQNHLEHTAPVHGDKSILDIIFPDTSLPADPVDLVVKDV